MSRILVALDEPYQALRYTLKKNIWISFALCSLGAFGVFIWLTATNANVYYAGDTQIWISGSEWLKKCFLQFNSEDCRRVSYWPIWNNGIALIFGTFTRNQMFLWYYLNVIAYIIYLLIVYFTIESMTLKWRFFIIYSIILSPLLFQVNSTCTEIQQGLFLTAGLLSFRRRLLILSAIFILLSITTKETFILVWSAILISEFYKDLKNIVKHILRKISWKEPTKLSLNIIRIFTCSSLKLINNKKTIALMIGISMGFLLNSGFNYIRYHQFRSAYFPQSTLFPVDLNHAALNFKWSLVSPNGGLIFGYGIFISVMLFHLLSNRSVRSFLLFKFSEKYNVDNNDPDLINTRGSLRELIVAINIFLLSGVVTTSLWWVVFGWDTWGHRLIVPYIMPTIVLTNLAVQKYVEFCEKRVERNRKMIFNSSEDTLKRVFTTYSFGILAVALAICGLTYNLATIQAVYRKDRNVFQESLYSQPMCQKMVSDDRGIAPYLWECTVERFRYIPILHHPPDLMGFEGRKLISIAIISLFINIILIPLRPLENNVIVH